MKLYRLLTDTQKFAKGTIFTFEQKHAFESRLPWEMTRAILWERVEPTTH